MQDCGGSGAGVRGLGDLIEAEERSRTYYRRGDTQQGWEGGTRDDRGWNDRGWNDNRPLDVEGPALNDLTGADLLGWSLVGQGSSKGALVGDTGIEPVTSSV